MVQLIDYVRAEGLERLYGSVLAENSTMMAMCSELGFAIRPDPDDADVVRAQLDLRDAAA